MLQYKSDNKYAMAVQYEASPATFAFSANFTITLPAASTVLSPYGAEKYAPGTTTNVTWSGFAPFNVRLR